MMAIWPDLARHDEHDRDMLSRSAIWPDLARHDDHDGDMASRFPFLWRSADHVSGYGPIMRRHRVTCVATFWTYLATFAGYGATSGNIVHMWATCAPHVRSQRRSEAQGAAKRPQNRINLARSAPS